MSNFPFLCSLLKLFWRRGHSGRLHPSQNSETGQFDCDAIYTQSGEPEQPLLQEFGSGELYSLLFFLMVRLHVVNLTICHENCQKAVWIVWNKTQAKLSHQFLYSLSHSEIVWNFPPKKRPLSKSSNQWKQSAKINFKTRTSKLWTRPYRHRPGLKLTGIPVLMAIPMVNTSAMRGRSGVKMTDKVTSKGK